MNEMNEIDDVLTEGLRRRAAEARLGGGSMADVQRRVVRRRRRVASAMCVAIVLPALVAVGFVIGQRSGSGDGVNAASNDGVAAATTSPQAAYCTLSGVDGTVRISPDQQSPTSLASGNWCGSYPGPCQSVIQDGTANSCVIAICASTDVVEPVPDTGWTTYPPYDIQPGSVPMSGVATTYVQYPSPCPDVPDGWRCSGDPTALGYGWTNYSYCEQVFVTATVVPATVVPEPITTTSILNCGDPNVDCTYPTSTMSP